MRKLLVALGVLLCIGLRAEEPEKAAWVIQEGGWKEQKSGFSGTGTLSCILPEDNIELTVKYTIKSWPAQKGFVTIDLAMPRGTTEPRYQVVLGDKQPNLLYVSKMEDPPRLLKQQVLPMTLSAKAGFKVEMKVRRENDTITVALNGRQVITVKDPAPISGPGARFRTNAQVSGLRFGLR